MASARLTIPGAIIEVRRQIGVGRAVGSRRGIPGFDEGMLSAGHLQVCSESNGPGSSDVVRKQPCQTRQTSYECLDQSMSSLICVFIILGHLIFISEPEKGLFL